MHFNWYHMHCMGISVVSRYFHSVWLDAEGRGPYRGAAGGGGAGAAGEGAQEGAAQAAAADEAAGGQVTDPCAVACTVTPAILGG